MKLIYMILALSLALMATQELTHAARMLVLRIQCYAERSDNALTGYPNRMTACDWLVQRQAERGGW